MSTPHELGLRNEELQDEMTQIIARAEEERQKIKRHTETINRCNTMIGECDANI